MAGAAEEKGEAIQQEGLGILWWAGDELKFLHDATENRIDLLEVACPVQAGSVGSEGKERSLLDPKALGVRLRVLLVGGPVPNFEPASAAAFDRYGFEPLLRVVEELSAAFFVKIHNGEPDAQGRPTKRVQIYG